MEKLIVVIEGPSGVGKDSIVAGLIKQHPSTYEKMPSTTSRPMREGERQGNPYYHVSSEEFEKKIKSGEVFEHTKRHGNYRGMCKSIIDEILEKGLIPMKDCDMTGVNALKKTYPNKVFTIFIKAQKKDIEERLKKRGDSEADRQIRLKDYQNTMSQEQYFDVSIENKNLEKTINQVHEIIKQRRQK